LIVSDTEYTYFADDSQQLGERKLYKLAKITFFHNGESILGFHSEYIFPKGERKQGKLLLHEPKQISSNKLIKSETLLIERNDSIIAVTGYSVANFIEYIQIETSKGQVLKAGNEKIKNKSKVLNYEIKKDEKPILFFGGLLNRKGKEYRVVYSFRSLS
jgi:hypothetical protein